MMLSKEVSDIKTTEVDTVLVAPVAGGQRVLSGPILKRFAINVASLFSVHVANMLLPMLTVPYVVRIIGPERLGLLNFSQAYVAYFTLFINYGFDTAAVRSVAANKTDRQEVNRIFNEVMARKAVLWVASTLIFGTLSWFVPEFREHLLLHVCTYLSCIGTMLFPIWLYQAMEDLGRVAIFNLVVKVLFSLSVFLLIRQPEDYVYQNLAMSVAQILVSVIAFRVALRRFRLTFTWPAFRQLSQRFRAESTLFFSSIMITLYAGSTVLLLGLLSNPYDVGIFSAGTRLESLSRSFVSLALNQAFFPVVASAFGAGREEGLRVVRTTFFPLMAFMMVLSAGLWLMAPWFITLFYGHNFQDSILVLRIIAVLPIIIGLSNLLGLHTMLNLHMDKAFFRITATGSVVGLLLGTVLIQQFGFVGAACAWVASEAFITLAMYGYLHTKGIQVIQRAYLREAVVFSKTRLATLFS